MAKRVDPLKAKQAKQKKMAIGLCVLLVAVLAFQGPKTLKMLKGPPAAAPMAAPAAAAAAAGAPVTPSIDGVPPAAAGSTPAAAGAQPAVLVDSDVPAAAGDGQLRSFELFQAKDPFAPQNVAPAAPSAAATPAQQPAETTDAKSSAGGTVIEPSPGTAGIAGTAGAAPAATPGTATTAAPTAASASATSISVNGLAENVAIDASFPAATPAFVLASAAKDGKSVQIGVAGGTYADGSQTIKLTLGKPLTLRNTADGSQYVLRLNAVAGFVPAKK